MRGVFDPRSRVRNDRAEPIEGGGRVWPKPTHDGRSRVRWTAACVRVGRRNGASLYFFLNERVGENTSR